MFSSTASSISKMSALVSGVGTDAAIYDDPQDADIPTLLDSRYDADKAQGLKRLIALMAQGQDVSTFFPQVVKGVASQSLEVKKLVYIYLVHYADKRPDEALLSINSFQRDLSDINPLVRAWALRAMSGIKVRAVGPLVIMAANKCARDPSPYVRRCAANAVSKIHSMGDEQHFDELVQLVSILLNDNYPGVAGAAAQAFISVCPERYSLLSSSFRKLCGLLYEADEWGQISLMDILMRYIVAKYGVVRDFSSANVEFSCLQQAHEENGGDFYKADTTFPDERWEVRLMLSSTLSLLRSQNSAVVLQAAVIHWYFSPGNELSNIVKPLLFLLRSSLDARHVVLANILSFSKCEPSLFEAYFEDFFICSSDSQAIQALKLDILTNIVSDLSATQILQELEAYIRNPNSQLAADAVNSIGRCALRLSSTVAICTKGLLKLVVSRSSRDDDSLHNANEAEPKVGDSGREQYSPGRGRVVVQAVSSLRAIMQKHPAEQDQVILHLLRNLNHILEPTAREVVIWMIGEQAIARPALAEGIPVALRYLAKTFANESNGTKLQVLNCLAKIISSSQRCSSLKTVLLILQYILDLAACDLNYDVRDRAWILRVLLAGHLDAIKHHSSYDADPRLPEIIDAILLNIDQSKLDPGVLSKAANSMFLRQKSVPVLPSLSLQPSTFLPGSMSHMVQHMSPGYRPLPRERYTDLSPSSPTLPERQPELQSQSESTDSGSESFESEDDGNYTDDVLAVISDADGNTAKEKADLISLSDTELLKKDASPEDLSPSVDLESWLGPEEPSNSPEDFDKSSNSEVKKVLALDFTNGDGLEVHYGFMRGPSIFSSSMVCVRLFLHNKSSEPMHGIEINDGETAGRQTAFESGTARIIPPEAVALEPGEKTELNAHVDFRHNLSIVKVWLHCNSNKFPIKISPEPGVLLRPRKMSISVFLAAEARIAGMHRSSRRIYLHGISPGQCCKRIVAAARVSFIGSRDAEDVVLLFGAETLTGSLLCLISVALEPDAVHGTLTICCEDTLFGLALLNHLDKALTSLESTDS
ncbi:AP3-complex subunit beta-A [Selaginella moellendorffii]|uniref:AP3-complex subunit beta-A n=1 Tax=Selaginella moellendorffii TaxID=88036 RepID=UPI000D1CA9FA|nr:AP3-complex subunit beta-A [Selaginella moellendorffii]|eukprot:XP_024544114.1 AP3-complex subunit beta-A [Selaginella moellendorffii]